jgi:hypothetical protein
MGLASYFVMRLWSGIYFIPEMLAFQKIPLDGAPSKELSARVSKWTFWTWFRQSLGLVSFLCFLLALHELKKSRAREVRRPHLPVTREEHEHNLKIRNRDVLHDLPRPSYNENTD